MFCARSALRISWEHLKHPNLLVRRVYRFGVYLHVQMILHHLSVSLPQGDGFRKVKKSYIKSTYYSIRDDYGANEDETWMNRDWFHTTKYDALVVEERQQKSLHQTTLRDGSLTTLKVLRGKVLKK